MSKNKNRIAELFCLGLLVVFGTLMVVCGMSGQQNIIEQKQVAVHVPNKTIYKTILKSDSVTDVIGFELHEDGTYSDGYITCPTYNVVVKGVNPMADDYKGMCKDIVSDIIKTCGDKQVIVNIYDSSEAYQLAVDFEAGRKMLNADEVTYTNDHKVATYFFEHDYNDPGYYLAFFPDANNILSEQVSYPLL